MKEQHKQGKSRTRTERDRASGAVGRTGDRDSRDVTGSHRSARPAGGTDGSGRSSGRRRPLVLAAIGLLAAAAASFWLMGGGDRVSASEADARSAAYETLVASGGLGLQLVRGDEVPQALESMPLAEDDKQEVAERVQQGRIRLAWLTVWDTHAEDGDVLSFQVPGSPAIEVMATNAPTTLALPYPADGQVLVTGVTDGGGGITIALKSGAAEIAWPTMRPGQQLNLPVTPTF